MQDLRFLQGQAVLVTGATGFIGQALVTRLSGLGAHVRAIVHTRSLSPVPPGVEVVRADLTRREACTQAVSDQRFLIMAATQSAPGNVVMDALMLEAAATAGVAKVLWLGSTTAYPPTGDRPVREAELFEGEPHSAYTAIGWTKRCSEILCHLAGKRTVTIVLRPTNVYGPGDNFDPGSCRVVPALVRKVVERWDPIPVWGTGNEVRDLLYIDDLVDAILLALERLEESVALNLGCGYGISVQQILQVLLHADGYGAARVTHEPSPLPAIPVRLVDVQAARTILGYEARTSPEEGLVRTLAWYRELRSR
jgi:GDP-L-fucose synthase